MPNATPQESKAEDLAHFPSPPNQHNVDNLERAAWFLLRLLRLAMRHQLLRERNTLATPGYR